MAGQATKWQAAARLAVTNAALDAYRLDSPSWAKIAHTDYWSELAHIVEAAPCGEALAAHYVDRLIHFHVRRWSRDALRTTWPANGVAGDPARDIRAIVRLLSLCSITGGDTVTWGV